MHRTLPLLVTTEYIGQSKAIPNCFVICVIYAVVSLGTEFVLSLLIVDSTMDIAFCKASKVMICWNGNTGVNSAAL